MWVRLICMANSRKGGHRCVAGLTPEGRWIRPVTTLSDGSVPEEVRWIDGNEPQLLDVLELPLAEKGPTTGHQCENRKVLRGKWKMHGRARVDDVVPFCSAEPLLLHTPTGHVPESAIDAMPIQQRTSLQLIAVDDAKFFTATRHGKPQCRVRFTYRRRPYNLVITDPLTELWMKYDREIAPRCLLTVSMGGPYDGDREPIYRKFVAAVIES